MDLAWLGLFAFIALVVLAFSGQYIAIALIIIGVGGFMLIMGPEVALSCMQYIPFSTVASYGFCVFPLFILMGELLGASGAVVGLFDSAQMWLGRLKGGLGMAVSVQACFIGAVTGSIMAACAMMTRTAYPQMIRHGYDPAASAGLIAAAGPIAIIIPPSVMLVFYGMIVEESIGRLLIAGILPGFMSGIIYMGLVYVLATLNPKKWPTVKTSYTWRQRAGSLKNIIPFVGVLVLVIGGIYTGVFTPTEAGAAGAFITLIILILYQRKKSPRLFYRACWEAAGLNCMIFFIIIGGMIYARFLAVTGISAAVVNYIAAFPVSPYVTFLMVAVFYIILGCFIESFPMLLITLPVTYPLMMTLGFDSIWFGVIACMFVGMSVITPPMGLAVFTLFALTEGKIELMKIFLAALPFLIAMCIVVLLLTIWPQIALFLPAMMY